MTRSTAIANCLAPHPSAPIPESQLELSTAALFVPCDSWCCELSTCVRQRSRLAVGEAGRLALRGSLGSVAAVTSWVEGFDVCLGWRWRSSAGWNLGSNVEASPGALL